MMANRRPHVRRTSSAAASITVRKRTGQTRKFGSKLGVHRKRYPKRFEESIGWDDDTRTAEEIIEELYSRR